MLGGLWYLISGDGVLVVGLFSLSVSIALSVESLVRWEIKPGTRVEKCGQRLSCVADLDTKTERGRAVWCGLPRRFGKGMAMRVVETRARKHLTAADERVLEYVQFDAVQLSGLASIGLSRYLGTYFAPPHLETSGTAGQPRVRGRFGFVAKPTVPTSSYAHSVGLIPR